MKFLRDLKEKITNSGAFKKLKEVKNLEIIIAALLAIIAIVVYFAVSTKGASQKNATQSTVEMTETEARVAKMISDIAGVGKARVLITNGADKEVVGVVVVAEGASDMNNRVKMIRLVEKATGASVDRIEIFEMEKGG